MSAYALRLSAPGEAADAIRALVCGYAPHARARKLMVMLQAFVDDSTSHVGDKRLFLAGYVNGADQWIAFSAAWQHELRRTPSLAYFKAVEANGLRGEFKGWSREDRDGKVLALARVIHNHRPWFVCCSVSREEYSRILAPVAPEGLKTPYFACFWGVITTLARYHQGLGLGEVPPVDFIFDEQEGLGDDAVLMYRWSKTAADEQLARSLGGPPIFRDDKLVVPLQAADMLAWYLRRQHERQDQEGAEVYELLTFEGVGTEVDVATLQGLAKKMRRVPGVRQLQTKAEWRKTKVGIRASIAAGDGPPSTNPLWMRYIAFRAWTERAVSRVRRWRRR